MRFELSIIIIIELRTDIVGNLSVRCKARRTRRGKRSVRYRVSYITIEVAQFDMQHIKNPDIEGTGYQHGPQFGFWNVREYVLWRDNHSCQCCHGKRKDSILNVHHIESRKTGGDSPDNLITLCETCHKAYHAGSIDLKLRRRFQSLRDAAAMNVMRWAVFHGLRRVADVPVFYTYGFITKYNRRQMELAKSHAVDARCISGNFAAEPVDTWYIMKQVRRHNRKVMKSKMLKGGKWKRHQASYEIKGFRLFDIVRSNGVSVYVHCKRSSGYFVIKDIDGKTVSNSISYRKLGLIRHSGSFLFNKKKRNGSIPPPAEVGSILEHLS